MPNKTVNVESSGNNEYETPIEIFNYWQSIFKFDLDVCASSENAKVKNFITREQNALITPWGYRNWMNPPYGKPEYVCKKNCKKKIC